MSTGAYLLVKFKDRNKLIPAIQSLNDSDKLTRWDAVDGHYNLVLKTDNAPTLTEQVKSLEGFDNLDQCMINTNNEPTKRDIDLTYSYVYIETDADKKDEIQKTIEALENTAFCLSTSGSFDLIVLLKGETFNEIDMIIKNNFRNLDGVLRFKQDHVIYLDRI